MTKDLKDSDTLRKYLSIPELIYILKNSFLYFERADLNQTYIDSYFIKESDEYTFIYGSLDSLKENTKNNFIDYLPSTAVLAKNMFINTWCSQESESFALWNILLERFDACVCIETNVENINNSFIPEIKITLQNISYEDVKPWSTLYKLKSNVYSPFFTKDVCYSFESEARLLISNLKSTIFHKSIVPNIINDQLIGLAIPVDLNKLISSIYIFPKAENFVFESLKDLILKFLPNCKIFKSEIENYREFYEN